MKLWRRLKKAQFEITSISLTENCELEWKKQLATGSFSHHHRNLASFLTFNTILIFRLHSFFSSVVVLCSSDHFTTSAWCAVRDKTTIWFLSISSLVYDALFHSQAIPFLIRLALLTGEDVMKNFWEGRELKIVRRKNLKIPCLFTLPKVYLNLIHVERLNNLKNEEKIYFPSEVQRSFDNDDDEGKFINTVGVARKMKNEECVRKSLSFSIWWEITSISTSHIKITAAVKKNSFSYFFFLREYAVREHEEEICGRKFLRENENNGEIILAGYVRLKL